VNWPIPFCVAIRLCTGVGSEIIGRITRNEASWLGHTNLGCPHFGVHMSTDTFQRLVAPPHGRLRMTRCRSGSLQLQRMKTSIHNTLPVYPAHGDAMSTSQHSQLPFATTDRTSLGEQPFMAPAIEIIDAAEMAARLKVKESWVVEESKPSRTSDPIPVFRLGKHRRYRWGSPEMNAWLWRRLKESSPYNRATTRG